MSLDLATALAMKQRKRLVASIMNAAEQAPWWAKLAPADQRAFRDKVLTSIGVYHDYILDVIGVCAETTVVNDSALEQIAQIHAGQRRLERAIGERG